ncbi:MAG: helix-turn-helix domain-containing protein [Phascolarctobacterium sp.]|nr:helix-turn-helix domain-containing protein [Phascolarctobacterium sp.]
MIKSRTYIAIPPGATIKEQLSDMKMTQKEFAVRMDMSEKHISKLINGEVQLTSDVAERLELVLGVPAKFWNNLEALYREKLAKAKAENEMDNDIIIAKNLPYNEMVKLGWVSYTKNPVEKVTNLRKFFRVVNLPLLEHSQISKIACRRLMITEKGDFALLAWANKVKILADFIPTAPINIKKLSNNLLAIKKMTTQTPEEFNKPLKDLLASCGIALVFLPHLKGSFLHGATFLSGNKIVLGLTTRGYDADKFWFSLFHELAHIALGHISKAGEIDEQDEKSADFWASDILIPKNDLELFLRSNELSHQSICAFANDIGIAPGIVVGRLQYDRKIKYSEFNELKEHYVIA